MAEMPALANEIALDSDGRIAQDMRCLNCGYNLRGLLPDGRCPECGIAVGRSAYGDVLRYCEPAWVESLASGANWLLASILVGILASVAGVAFAAASGTASPMMIGLVWVLVALIGCWKLTAPDPSELEQNTKVRQVARWGMLASLALSLLGAAGTNLGLFGEGLVVLSESIISLAAMVVLFIYAGRLAIRIPDEALVRQTRTVMWGLIVAQVLEIVPVGLVWAVAGQVVTGVPAGGPTTAPAGGMSAIPAVGVGLAVILTGLAAGVLYLVFGIWSFFLLLRYRREFRDCANQARLTWAASRPDEAGGMRNYPEVR